MYSVHRLAWLSVGLLLAVGPAVAGDCPSDEHPLQLVIEGGGEISSTIPAGSLGTADVHVVMRSNLVNGVQGWSLSLATEGDLLLTGATTAGTSAADVSQGGVRNGGFEVTELVDPSLNDQGQGAVSAVVLSFTMPVILEPVGSVRILTLNVTANALQPDGEDALIEGDLLWRDDMQGAGQPVQNVATVSGATQDFGCCENAHLSFQTQAAPEVSDFIRCDANNDGRSNIADAIWIINELVRKGPATTCAAAADCNSDANRDLTDAVFAIAYQFQGGAAPGAPFPECGGSASLVESGQGGLCLPGSASCSE